MDPVHNMLPSQEIYIRNSQPETAGTISDAQLHASESFSNCKPSLRNTKKLHSFYANRIYIHVSYNLRSNSFSSQPGSARNMWAPPGGLTVWLLNVFCLGPGWRTILRAHTFRTNSFARGKPQFTYSMEQSPS